MAAKDDFLAPGEATEIGPAARTGASRSPAEDSAWKRSPVDIRFTLPFFGRKFYVTVVSGAEKRSPDRRAEERHHYPLRTVANVFFFIGLATLFYMAAVIALALQSAIVEF